MAATRGSSAFRTAARDAASASSPLARAMASTEPNSPRWLLPTTRTTPTWGRPSAARRATWPPTRAPPSPARGCGWRRPSRGTVSGTPRFVVPGAGRRHHGAARRADGGQEVLRGRLARGAGDAHDVRGQALALRRRERGQGGGDVRHDDTRHARHLPREQRRRRTGRDGTGGVVVPVGPLPGERHEQVPGGGGAAVQDGAAGHGVGGRGAPRRVRPRPRPRRPGSWASRGGDAAGQVGADGLRQQPAGRRRAGRGPPPPGRSRGPCPPRAPCPPARRRRRPARPRRRGRAPPRSARPPPPPRRPPRRRGSRPGPRSGGCRWVSTARSAPRTAAAPMSGRLPRSRSPPQPSTTTSRPGVRGRSAARTVSTASGVCA